MDNHILIVSICLGKIHQVKGYQRTRISNEVKCHKLCRDFFAFSGAEIPPLLVEFGDFFPNFEKKNPSL